MVIELIAVLIFGMGYYSGYVDGTSQPKKQIEAEHNEQ